MFLTNLALPPSPQTKQDTNASSQASLKCCYALHTYMETIFSYGKFLA